jgi:hypothetical protein
MHLERRLPFLLRNFKRLLPPKNIKNKMHSIWCANERRWLEDEEREPLLDEWLDIK